MGDHQQFGVVALSSSEDYANGLIKKHELTLPGKEQNRTTLCDVQGANAGPVFLAFKEGDLIKEKISEIVKTEPYGHVVSDDGFEHSLWKVPVEDSDAICEAFGKIEATYVADGHHRAAAAYNVAKLRKERAAENGIQVTGDEPFNYFMTILYPSDNLKILDYNRVLKSLNDMTGEEFREKLSKYYTITELPSDAP